ncbi:Nucleotide exchange factor SIL1 precursor,putative [Gryllus bimaculatus]|nr:Nucleotide exchange factor SIL1 precursor,putative [Gryllus bimaculatus]
MDYTDAKEYILALRKLLPELENTRNKTQTCKLVVLKLKINEKTDLEITRSLITKFKKIRSSQEDTSPNELALMLSCLEHFMNDFNNAHEFENLNGIEDIIFPTVVSTVPIIKAEAALLLASAALHSPKVQISALRSGVIAFLLKSIVLESDVIVQINSMLAVTSILKDYPQAQAKFVEVGGLRTLAQVVEKSYENDRVLVGS